MAYDDIKISELPDIRSVENDDSLVINDATNNLTYKVDWRDLKNSIGTISNGIIFPLGDQQMPSVAIGDYSSGIYAEDYGTFHIVTQARNRIKVNQAGTTQIYNGHIVLGNIDRACFWSLNVYNTTTFHCLVNMEGGLQMPGLGIDSEGNIITDGNLIVGGDVELGTDCDNTIIIHGQLIAECDLILAGNLLLDGNIVGKGDLIIEGNGTIGTGCDNTLNINAETTIECDTHIKGDLTLDGNLNIDGGIINIGDPDADCGETDINLNGDTTVKCDLEVKGNAHIEGSLDIDTDLNVNGDVNIGSGGCDQGEVNIDAPTHINCDLTVDGNLNVSGDGPHIIGQPGGGNGLTPCSEQADCPNGTLCYAGFCYPLCDINDPTSCPNGTCTVVNIDGFDYEICVPDPLPIDCDNAPDIDLNGNVNVSCDLTVGGDTHLNGNLEVDGGLTIGKPGAECDESPVEIHGDTDISCDLTVEGDTNLHNVVIDGNLVINPPGGGGNGAGGGLCPDGLDSECPVGYECIDGWCYPQISGPLGCPPGSIDVNGRCYPECSGIGDTSCPDGFECTEVELDDGTIIYACMPSPATDCDDAPEIDINADLNVHCDLFVGGDIHYHGGVLGDGNISLGEKCDDLVEIGGTLNAKCDVNVNGDIKVEGTAEIGTDCNDTIEINGNLNVACDASFGGNVTILEDLTILNGDLNVNSGVISGDGSGLVNLNIPGSFRFKGTWNAGDPPPFPVIPGDFYINNSGDGSTPSIESNPQWQYTENLPNGSVNGPNGQMMVLLNQHMIYTVDNTWILGSIMSVNGYVTLDTEQTITHTKNFDHNVVSNPGDPGPEIIVPERTIELRHDYGVYARDYAINELNAIPRKP